MDKFISDTHLGHENIIKFERKKFKTIREHDNHIKQLILTNVRPNDTLYHLGDVGEMTKENIQFWKNLPCKTILIRGNHDTQKNVLEKAFDIVSDTPLFYKKRILLSHEPLPVTNETINIHGHLHAAYLNKSNYLNLSIHVANYKLLTSKDIDKLLMVTPKISQKFMYEWYAENYIFTQIHDDIVFQNDGKIDLQSTRKLLFEKPRMRQKLKQTVANFLNEFPDYKNANIESEIKNFILKKYQNNANFTPSDIEKFINDPNESE